MSIEDLKKEHKRDRGFAKDLHACLEAMFQGEPFNKEGLLLSFGATRMGLTKTVDLSSNNKELVGLILDAPKIVFFYYHNRPEELNEEERLIQWSVARFANIPYKYLTFGYAYTIPEPNNLDHWQQCKNDAKTIFTDPRKGPSQYITIAPGAYERFFREEAGMTSTKLRVFKNEYGVQFIRYCDKHTADKISPSDLPGLKP